MYTTTQIQRGLGIPRERLREWIARGFIKPTVPAPAQGQAAEFSFLDVCLIQTFKELVEMGITRKLASGICFLYLKGHPKIDDLSEHYIMYLKNDHEEEARIVSIGSPHYLKLDAKTLDPKLAHEDPRDLVQVGEWDKVLLINLQKIRGKVAAAVGEK